MEFIDKHYFPPHHEQIFEMGPWKKVEEKLPIQLSLFDESRVLEANHDIIVLPDQTKKDDEAA